MVPWGLYKAVTYVKEQYGNPRMFIAENGKIWILNANLYISYLIMVLELALKFLGLL